MEHVKNRKGYVGRPFLHLFLICVSFVMVFPFIWMVSTSLKTFAESIQIPPTIIPTEWVFGNYKDVLRTSNFLIYYRNTIIQTIGRTVGQLFFCTLAAYSFARIRFPGKNALFLLTLSVLMIPQHITLIPVYIIIRSLGWLNTFYALIVPQIFSAFGVFLMRQFFLTIPQDLDQAAKIDGCNHWSIYSRIYLPLSRAAMISLLIFTVLNSWNDLILPLVVTSSDSMRVLTVGLAAFQGQYSTNYPLLMAGAVMAIFPLILLFVFLQRYYIEGIAVSGIKG